MSTQRILIIRNAASYDFGGGERFPVFLAQVLALKNLESVIVSRSKKLRFFAKENNVATIRGWWWSKQQWSGVNNILIPVYISWQLLLFFYYFFLILKINPSVVHIQSKDDFIAATIAAKTLRKRVIWTDHADLKHVWRNITVWYKNPIGKCIYWTAHLADSITVVSKSEFKLVSSNFPINSKITHKLRVIYNGVMDVASEYKHEQKHTRLFTFLVASRLVRDKGIYEVIGAFKLLHEKNPDIELCIIGDGPEADFFKKSAAETPSIKILGHQDQPLKFMSSADAFIHPTYHEGFSVALVEAGMMSLPIIATSVGGNVEIIKDNTTGLLVPPKNIQSLYNAMETVYMNRALRLILAKNARNQYLKRFQFNIIVEECFIPLYRGDL